VTDDENVVGAYRRCNSRPSVRSPTTAAATPDPLDEETGHDSL
jgi:hypothetical protein